MVKLMLILQIVWVVISSVGSIANIFLLLIILKEKSLRENSANHFIVALAVADLMMAQLGYLELLVN
jgi:Serpentine type 7TM GPCR chemoreceptor Srw